MKSLDLTCICCPMGCQMNVEVEGNKTISVKGNGCMNGKKYAENEISTPKRMFTSSLHVRNGDWEMVSVKSSLPVPKESVMEVSSAISGISVSAPVHIGQVLLHNVLGLGVDLIATREIKTKE